jgi:hypothetical protein
MNLNMRFRVLFVILFIGINSIIAQDDALLNIENGFVPERSNSVGFNNSYIEINVSSKISKGVLTNSVFYSEYRLKYSSDEFMNTEYLEQFRSIGYTLKYFNTINSEWSYNLALSPTISSNLESNVSFRDVILNGSLIFTKKYNNSKFELGLVNNSNYGYNSPIPLITFSSKIANNLSYKFGFPESTLNYQINSKNNLNLYVKPKGYYANLSNKIVLNESDFAEKSRFRSVISGLNYEHTIDDYWKILFDAGYQLSSNYDLLNNNNRVYQFNAKNSFYVGFNLKFDLLKENN